MADHIINAGQYPDETPDEHGACVLSQTIDHSAPRLEEIFIEGFEDTGPGPGLGADFAKLWGATTASNLSDGIRVAALPLLAAATTSDPRQIAGVVFATQAPWLLFGIASGAIVDRFERRRIIAAAHLFRMAVVTLLAVMVGLGTVHIAALYLAAFLLGTAETLFDNASQVIVPELVHERQLERAHGRQGMAMLVGQHLVGPLAGAALFAAATPAPLLVDGIVLALAAILVLGIKRRPTQQSAERDQNMRADVGESLKWLWRQRTLRSISLAAAAVNIAVMAHIAIFVLFSLEVLGVSGVGYAAILACYAVGGIVGGWAAPRLTDMLGWRRSAVWALIGGAMSVLLTGMTSSPLVTAAMQVILGIAASIWMVVTCSLRQRLTPDHMLGRITGAHALLSWGGGALGAILGGVIASGFGLRAPFLLGGLLLCGVALAVTAVTTDRHAGGCAA